jgi:DNA-binding beta-propeller fold protein YncE
VTKCEFEYGTTASYGSVAPCSSLPGSGESAVAVSASVTGLAANTTYHFRVSATNAGGTSKGSDETLKTMPNAPTVVTKAATSVTQTTATLNASVIPNGGTVSECKIEYGTTTEYKSGSATCTPSPGSGESAVAVSASVAGLSASTTYHFRISATNSSGTSKGADETFESCTAEGFCTSFSHGAPGEFAEPNAVAVDPSGDIWVAAGRDQVLEFNSKREYVRQFGKEGSGEGQFKGIGGIASDATGDIWVTDSGNNRVEEFSPTGAYLRQFGSAGTGAGQFSDPVGIALDSSGNVWVLNTHGVLVQEFSATGTYISGFGTTGWFTGGGAGLAFSGADLYITEPLVGRVQEYSSTGTSLAIFDERGAGNGKSQIPSGIATDPSTGNLYVADFGSDRIQEFGSSGTFIATFGSEGSGAGQFSYPRAVAVGSSGRFFVADTGNNRVEEWLTSP